MSGIEKLIQEAWRTKVLPRLLKDRAELERRKARMGAPALSRPPRAWCLAVRASDRRVSGQQAACSGQQSISGQQAACSGQQLLPHCQLPAACCQLVSLDCRSLRDLCYPVEVTPGGETWDDLAKKLGTGFTGLRHARIDGRLRARYVKNLDGKWGAPVPILSSDDLLDPGARGWVSCDPIWGVSTCDLFERVPEDFAAELMRVPLYRSHVRKGEFDDSLHPEVRNSPGRGAGKRLAPPPPDYVWYKWSKAGEFLGENPKYWRKSAEDPGKPPPPGAGMKKKYKRKPKPRVGGGSQHFIGWAWVCPRCGQKCRTIYLPFRPAAEIRNPNIEIRSPASGEIRNPNFEIRNKFKGSSAENSKPPVSDISPGALDLFRISDFELRISDAGFACYRCHRIRSFSRIDAKNSWNELVSYISGGLMYGREVEMPANFGLPTTRKRVYRPRLVKPRSQGERVPSRPTLVSEGVMA